MRYIVTVLAICGLFIAGLTLAAEEPKVDKKPDPGADAPKAGPKTNTLIITGADPAHNWKDNAACVKEILEAAGRFQVKVVEDYNILDSADDLKAYDVLVLIGSFQTKKGFEISEKARANLLAFVKDGKGFYVQHLASASWETWEEFAKLCGWRWVNGKSGHGPRTPFEAKITDAEHPITKGLKDFTTDDELYSKLQGAPEKTLVTAFSADFSKQTEPLLVAHDYGKGHVVVSSFGHDRKAMTTPETRTIIARSVEWAASGKVSP